MAVINWRSVGRGLFALDSRIRGIGAGALTFTAKRARGAGGEFPDNPRELEGSVYTLRSPNGKITAEISAYGELTYSVKMNGATVVNTSPIGVIAKRVDLGGEVSVGKPEISVSHSSYYLTEIDGEVKDNHIRYLFPVRHIASGLEYNLEVKLWNDGFGFRLIFTEKTRLLIKSEKTRFNMPVDSLCRYQTDMVKLQGKTLEQVSRYLPQGVDFACLTQFELQDNAGYALITEANLNNYPGAALKSLGKGALQIDFWDSGVFYIKGGACPWRLVICCETLEELVNSHIITSVNDPAPPEIEKAQWIKPGKSSWSYFVNMEHSRDFDTIMNYNSPTAALGLDYSLIDSGWRRWAITERGAFKKVALVTADAKQKGVGIWVWKAATAGPLLKCYRNYFFKQCVKAGVKGVKLDYNESETQVMINFYRNFVKEAAEHKLMVIYHNPQKPTGLMRTYPNLLSMEAVRGMQCGCDPDDSVIIPFTRLVAGSADYTPFCFSVDRRRGGASIGHLLGSSVIISSLFLTVSEDVETLANHTIGEFARELPVQWHETRVLPPTQIGTAVYYARRCNDGWFIAGMNSTKGDKTCDLPLDFLLPGTSYNLVIFTDGFSPLEINRAKLTVTCDTVLRSLKMLSGGGFAGFLKEADTIIY